jgi:hypothetical protein
LVTDTIPQLSLAIGVPNVDALILASHEPPEEFTVMFAGHVRVGGMLSFIVTVKEQVAELLAASFAV